MTSPRKVRKYLAIFGIVAALAFPASALAAEQEATSPETLSIPLTISLTGAPTSIDYGVVSLTNVPYEAAPFTLGIASTGQATLTVEGSEFVGSLSNLVAAYRSMTWDPDGMGDVTLAGDLGTGTFAGTIGSIGSSSASYEITPSFMTDALVAGSFTGSVTFTLTSTAP